MHDDCEQSSWYYMTSITRLRKWILAGTCHRVYIVQEVNLLGAVKACYVIMLLYGVWKICCRKHFRIYAPFPSP
jgi:hypothetical protein